MAGLAGIDCEERQRRRVGNLPAGPEVEDRTLRPGVRQGARFAPMSQTCSACSMNDGPNRSACGRGRAAPAGPPMTGTKRGQDVLASDGGTIQTPAEPVSAHPRRWQSASNRNRRGRCEPPGGIPAFRAGGRQGNRARFERIRPRDLRPVSIDSLPRRHSPARTIVFDARVSLHDRSGWGGESLKRTPAPALHQTGETRPSPGVLRSAEVRLAHLIAARPWPWGGEDLIRPGDRCRTGEAPLGRLQSRPLPWRAVRRGAQRRAGGGPGPPEPGAAGVTTLRESPPTWVARAAREGVPVDLEAAQQAGRLPAPEPPAWPT